MFDNYTKVSNFAVAQREPEFNLFDGVKVFVEHANNEVSIFFELKFCAN